MGGHLAGEIASRISVDIINKSFQKWVEEDAGEDMIYGGPDDTLSKEGNYILGGIRLANKVVYELALEQKQYQGMGTTVVVLLVTPSMIIAANVGDSRIYLARGRELEMLSRDHSIVAEQVALGMMTEEEAVLMMREIKITDPEQAHLEADDILLTFLEEHGYTWLVESYQAARKVTPFWYA